MSRGRSPSKEPPGRPEATGPEVLASLPRARPQLPSRHRAPHAGRAAAQAGHQPAGAGRTAGRASRNPGSGQGAVAAQRAQQTASASQPAPDLISTALQLGGELAEIGLAAASRAIHGALSRLPRP